ncbi:MAG: D-glycerate dehydrogenase [Desulfomonile tiedjei]|uniref:D-glycerate dehydrogenase n=1 Tax=Desulfomonile tiedjei TaxID=2358 RepID=A0A9D6V7T8_9BACT|nr:D-glycerate dehydrogenase [Desulfomonile tiedjei]
MRVLITARIPEEIVSTIRSEHEIEINEFERPMDRADLLARVRDKEGLLCTISDRVDKELLTNAPLLKMIANYGVGFDHIDLDAATARAILVSNTPGVLTDATAELTFALILAVARRVVEGDQRTRKGHFRFWAPLLFLGRQVTGKTLGIIGFGQIGKAVARRATGFDMRVLYYSRTRLDASIEQKLSVEHRGLDDLLTESDFVSLHVPLTDKTLHMIGARELNLMKRSAYLINAARGPVVNERELVEALRAGKIAGAGLDVYENEPKLTPGLVDLENVVLLPHVGSATVETRTRMGEMAAENLLAGLRSQTPPNCLNCSRLASVKAR